jgi:hypothetical protein
MQTTIRVAFAALFVLCGCKHSPAPAPPAQSWIERSNLNAQVLLDVQARFFPEGGARLGIAGIDDRITDLTRARRAAEGAGAARAVAKRRAGSAGRAGPGHPRRGGAAPGA